MEEKLNDRLKRLLKSKGMTQKSLARLTGIPEPTISHYVSGYRNPELPALRKLADALGVSLSELGDPRFHPYEETRKLIKDHKEEWSDAEKLALAKELMR